ncbi:MAG: DUF402 domain-containing protein [Tepidiformaceae bacterium]
MDAEHTPPPEPLATRTAIVERKQKPDGSWREYACTLLHHEAGVAVVEFVMAKGGEIFGTPIVIPTGSISHGYFWTRRPFNLYRMRTADGEILAHRFDAVADVRVARTEVSYRDLALDWWVYPDGTLIEEDRDEFEALVASGKFAERDVRAAEAAARAIYSRYRHIIDDVAVLERRLGIG